MSLKFVFAFFAVVVVAYGLPAAESESDSKALNEVPAQVDSYLEQLFSADASLASEMHDGGEALNREKRACKTIQFRSRSGRVVSARRC